MKIKVIGIREEHYVGTTVSGHNCDFTYSEESKVRHVILGVGVLTDIKYEITLSQSEGECGSGWCTATFGEKTIEIVDEFRGYNYKPIKPMMINVNENCYDDDENEVYSLSINGWDAYYPDGSYNVHLNLFEPTVRCMSNRPTYVFKGDSGVGKSWLARHTDLVVFETDSVDELPDEIVADIVVLGNRSGFTIDDVNTRLKDDTKSIIVEIRK